MPELFPAPRGSRRHVLKFGQWHQIDQTSTNRTTRINRTNGSKNPATNRIDETHLSPPSSPTATLAKGRTVPEDKTAAAAAFSSHHKHELFSFTLQGGRFRALARSTYLGYLVELVYRGRTLRAGGHGLYLFRRVVQVGKGVPVGAGAGSGAILRRRR